MTGWDKLWGFLTFRSFISPVALFAFYYLGAVAIPFLSWFLSAWLWRRYAVLPLATHALRGLTRALTRRRDRWLFLILSVAMFLLMELLWRMMFEFLMAYLQIRDALLTLTAGGPPP